LPEIYYSSRVGSFVRKKVSFSVKAVKLQQRNNGSEEFTTLPIFLAGFQMDIFGAV